MLKGKSWQMSLEPSSLSSLLPNRLQRLPQLLLHLPGALRMWCLTSLIFPPPLPATPAHAPIIEALKVSPPVVKSEGDADEGFALPPILRRLATTELGHGLRFRAGTLQGFKDVISDNWDSALGTALEQAIHTYDSRMKIPRARSDRI